MSIDHSAEFRRCLTECDIPAVRKLWAHVSPHLPQPASEHDTLVTIHYARTQASSVETKLRCYSHSWLIDHDYPSGLPDYLKPLAERLYPRVVEAVGIAVSRQSSASADSAGVIIRQHMENAVLECVDDRIPLADVRVRERIKQARAWMRRKLFG